MVPTRRGFLTGLLSLFGLGAAAKIQAKPKNKFSYKQWAEACGVNRKPEGQKGIEPKASVQEIVILDYSSWQRLPALTDKGRVVIVSGGWIKFKGRQKLDRIAHNKAIQSTVVGLKNGYKRVGLCFNLTPDVFEDATVMLWSTTDEETDPCKLN